ncbi:MAG: GNAT family N-acetyltransferase [Herpetosiphonaceae bacterium]|nr:GNAT family N-acetyltransferase [Herpetosiphonaceae bacterium]
MALSVRRLGPGDESILHFLAANDADFDLEGRGEPLRPLDADTARRYLENPAVLHWIATEGDTVAGFLYCLHLPLRADDGHELLLYEIGVHIGWRRHGVGRALAAAMDAWMQANAVPEVWVLADNPVAVEFYRACGFAMEDAQPVYMTRRRAENDG